MVTRDKRLEDFQSVALPEDDKPVQLLCEDKRGTYTPPFPCRWTNNAWHNVATGDAISADVIGWRHYRDKD
jgi:hypothetical protein